MRSVQWFWHAWARNDSGVILKLEMVSRQFESAASSCRRKSWDQKGQHWQSDFLTGVHGFGPN